MRAAISARSPPKSASATFQMISHHSALSEGVWNCLTSQLHASGAWVTMRAA